MKPKFLIACDTLPGSTFDRDRLPAIREALSGYDHEIFDLFAFTSKKESHEIRRGNIKAWFAKADLKLINKQFFHNLRFKGHYGLTILVINTLDLASLFLFPETIKALQGDGIKVVCVFGDDEFMLNRHSHWVDRFDACVTFVKWCADYYNNIVPGSTYYLPGGVDFPEKSFEKLQVPEKEKEFDIVFIGNPFGERLEIVQSLNKLGRLKNLRIGVYGNWEGYPEADGINQGFLDADHIGAAIRNSKLTVVGMGDHLTGAPHHSGTFWTVIKEGQLPVCSYYPIYTEDYGFNVSMFKGPEDLWDVVSPLLKNADERRKRARELFEKVKKDFDFVNLYRELFKSLENL